MLRVGQYVVQYFQKKYFCIFNAIHQSSFFMRCHTFYKNITTDTPYRNELKNRIEEIRLGILIKTNKFFSLIFKFLLNSFRFTFFTKTGYFILFIFLFSATPFTILEVTLLFD